MPQNKLTRIQQGESLPFKFDRGGDTVEGWTCTITLKQFPSDVSSVTRVITLDVNNAWSGFLTNSETDTLDAVRNKGTWYLTATLINLATDELEQIPVRFSVTKKWA